MPVATLRKLAALARRPSRHCMGANSAITMKPTMTPRMTTMLDNFGQVPLTDYLGLGIVLFSYAGKLCWGFTADWDLLPDLHEVVKATADAFEELRDAAAAASPGESADVARRPPRSVRTGGTTARAGSA